MRIPSTEFKSPWVAPRMQLFDMLSATVSLTVFMLVMSLIVYRLRSVLAPLRNVQSMETIIWTLVGASIEAGALLVLAQAAVVVLFVLNSPMIIIVEGIATQVYVRVFPMSRAPRRRCPSYSRNRMAPHLVLRDNLYLTFLNVAEIRFGVAGDRAHGDDYSGWVQHGSPRTPVGLELSHIQLAGALDAIWLRGLEQRLERTRGAAAPRVASAPASGVVMLGPNDFCPRNGLCLLRGAINFASFGNTCHHPSSFA